MAKAAKAAGSSARFRQRKISVKQTLAVLKQSDIPDLEEEQQRELQQIETGVEKGEEEEHHLQAAINSSIAQSTGAKVEKIYIPTPDASQVWKEYDRFYSSSFHEPASYIRTSVTVEETSGCLYNMDDEDAEFLKTCKPPISEDDFEEVMHRFEVTISEKQPFVSIDVSNLLSFEEMAQHIEEGIRQVQEDPSSPEYILAQLQASLGITVNGTRGKNEGKAFLATFKKIGAVIYPHWRARKVERKGQSIVPHLKFEDHEKDDSDPYVCFRRRELRQVRKTRRTDVLSIERLRRMQAEMETAKQLVEMIAQREFTRKAALKAEWDVFEDRCAIKTLKRELGIKGEEEDLVAQKKRKVEPKKEEKSASDKAPTPVRGKAGLSASAGAQAAQAAAQAAGQGSPSVSSTHVPPNVSIPPSKIPNMDLITIAQVVRDKDEAIAKAVREKLRLRADADRDWHNLTNSGYIPYCEYLNAEVSSSGEPPVPQYSSINEMAYFEKHNASHVYTTKSDFNKDLASMVANKPFADAQVYGAVVGDNGELRLSDATASQSPQDRAIPRSSFMSMRKRMGRGGRVWMDRRGLQRHTELKPSSLAKNSLDEITETDDVAMERLADRLKYDRETEPTRQMSSYDKDPSQLNGISSDTQSIRFGSMLLSKAYENYREVFQARQQQLMMLQQQILQQQQQQQMRNRQQSHPPGDPGAGIGGGAHGGPGGGPGGSRNNSPAPGANGPQSKMPMGYNKQGMTPSQHQQYQAMQQQQQQQQQRKMGAVPMNAATAAAAAMAAQPRRASGSPDGQQRFNGLPNGAGAMANGVLSNGMGQRMMPGGDMKQKSELAKVDA